ncbi:hypothetical protein [Legionella cherrii]|uniref:Uncharacterized protein n=1 Tax=Legionella cherrii TaxID=28084 RepID=A0A0W0S6S6_9GAMM|nr:hypothetical protein [Legionella cherrii]KTC78804.1 hypothetical protein Lche_0824 [Legionella cherrii]VEB35633.1 Uncharacterised protein [Legionella cherrii]
MPHFQNLQNILDMDFKQMRAIQGHEGMRATDEAIHLFIDNLISFFSQFNEPPTGEQLKTYQVYMEKITNKINASEYAYYLNKYSTQYPKNAENMASGCMLKSFKDLPNRMQYWAASEKFGEAIRNAKNHSVAVKKLNKWAYLINQYNKNFFFQHQEEQGVNKENISPQTDTPSFDL